MTDLHPVIDLLDDSDAAQPALHTRDRRDSERGFSLIELIIVIVILGILVAIAIPVYNNIQSSARKSATDTAASNAASQASAQLATNPDESASDLTAAVANLVSGHVTTVTITLVGDGGVDGVCAKATEDDDNSYSKFAGPGANSDGTACKTASAG